jgi:hypothetical protein
MMNRKTILLTILSLCFVTVSARADSYSAWKFEMLQGLAQSSDTVVTATIESVAVGVRGDIYRDTTDTKVKCVVENVYLGAKHLKGETITVVFGAADEPIQSPSTKPVLLLLRKENDNYRLSFFHTHGIFRLEKGIVQVAFEPKKKGLYWSYYTLKEIISRIKTYSTSKVEMATEVADNIALFSGYLPVKFSFLNTGKTAILLLPPSYCFNSLWIKKIVTDPREVQETSWWGVDHWEFVRASEPLLKLDPGSERSYSYQIPFADLHIDVAGRYQVNFFYHPYQLSTWATKAQITDKQMRQVWLGVPKKTSYIISIKSAE